MARGFIRKPSFNKIIGAYRSQWKRFWMRLFTFGMYGKKGMGWWRNPRKAWYNFWYHRSSVSVYDILGCKPSRGACFFAMMIASAFSIIALPVDVVSSGVKAKRESNGGKKKEKKSAADGVESRATSNTATQNTFATRTSAQQRTASSHSITKSDTATKRTADPSPSKSSSSTVKKTTVQSSLKTPPTYQLREF